MARPGGVETAGIIPFLIGLRVYGFLFSAVLALSTHLAALVVPRRAD